MTKLELTVSVPTLDCLGCGDYTADILGCRRILETRKSVHMSVLLANLQEFQSFDRAVASLVEERDRHPSHLPQNGSFTTLNLVFSAPNADMYGVASDRKALQGVFASPMQAIHCCGELQLACFTHIELSKDGETLKITALEYSREHRRRMLQQEFGSWLLEEHIEKSVIATTMAGEIVFWNKYATHLYQHTIEETLGKNIVEITPAHLTQQQAVEIMSALASGRHWSGMFTVQRKDGSTFVAHVSDTPIMDAGGTTKFIVGVSDDYTRLHHVMDELERLNRNLEEEVKARTAQILEHETTLRMVGAAIKASDTGVIVTDETHRITWSNDAVLQMLRLASPSPDQASNASSSTSSLQGRYLWELEALRDERCGDGDQSVAEWLKAALTADDQRASGLVESGIVAVRKMELVEALSVTVQRLSDEEKTQTHMITFRDMTAHTKAAEAQSQADAAKASSESKTEMMQMLSHELRTPLQGILGVASSLLRDLTPENTNLFDGASTIVASSRLLLTLIGNVLDFRKLELKLMADVDLGPVPVATCVEESVRYCVPFATCNEVTLSAVLGDNSKGSATGPGGGGASASSSNPSGIGGNKNKSGGASCTNGWIVTANRLRLEQVLVNLLTNGIKYTKPGSRVEVSMRRTTTKDALAEARSSTASDLDYLDPAKAADLAKDLAGDVVIVSIRDYGPGIPADESDKVFAAFVQLRISAEQDRNYQGGKHGNVGQSSGTGLGLNLSMKFLEKMGGHIWYQNCQSGGVVFSFCLPACDALDDDREMAEAIVDHSTRLTPAEAVRFRVLLVDDSLINVKVLARMLVRLGVKYVHSAYSGTEALQFLHDQDEFEAPNLILSDLQMPEMNGEQLVGHLRKLPQTTNTMIMACTADWTSTVERRCREAGFNGILRKPITIEELEEFLVRKAAEDPDHRRYLC